jgi:PelA/Pel-15E family pectate lyase
MLFQPLTLLAAGGGAVAYLKKPDEWFSSPEGHRIAANILSYQSDSGGWPKNTDTVAQPHTGDRKKLKPTFDNGATTDELRFLARRLRIAPVETERMAFTRGLAYILIAQYSNGGWPQHFPPGKNYHRHITFNDGAMVRLMEFLREVHRDDAYAFVPAADRDAAGEAFEKGIDCILKCQIRVDDRPTVWCAQHDETDFTPRPARAYELASFSGSESVAITRLLMSLEAPEEKVIAAVEGAVAWLESAKISGLRAERKNVSGQGRVLVMENDPAAPPLWARFYDLESGKPIFCDRDGIPKASLSEIGAERRNGYAWYGTWPQALLAKDYPKWRKKLK